MFDEYFITEVTLTLNWSFALPKLFMVGESFSTILNNLFQIEFFEPLSHLYFITLKIIVNLDHSSVHKCTFRKSQ